MPPKSTPYNIIKPLQYNYFNSTSLTFTRSLNDHQLSSSNISFLIIYKITPPRLPSARGSYIFEGNNLAKEPLACQPLFTFIMDRGANLCQNMMSSTSLIPFISIPRKKQSQSMEFVMPFSASYFFLWNTGFLFLPDTKISHNYKGWTEKHCNCLLISYLFTPVFH